MLDCIKPTKLKRINMKNYKEFLNEGYLDIDAIRSKIGVPSFKEISSQFSGDKFDNDNDKLITYSFELSIIFDGFEPTILEGKLLFSEDPKKGEMESRIKNRLKVFHNISSYQILSFEKSKVK